jgi:hypothetical protein
VGDQKYATAIVAALRAHRVYTVKLSALEPELGRGLHYLKSDYAVMIDLGQPHVVAIAQTWNVVIDGPRKTERHNVDAKEVDDLAPAIEQIAQVIEDWKTRPERLGVADATLALKRMLKFHGPWLLSLHGMWSGVHGYVTACRSPDQDWPVSLYLESADDGVELRCGDSRRILRTRDDLAEFPTRELPMLLAQIAQCKTHVIELERAKPFAAAALELANDAFPNYQWQTWTEDKMFRVGAPPTSHLVIYNCTGKVDFEAVPGGVTMRCESFVTTFANVGELEAQRADVLAAIEAALPSLSAENTDYR